MEQNKLLFFIFGLLLLVGCKTSKPLISEGVKEEQSPSISKPEDLPFEKRMTLSAMLFDGMKFSVTQNYVQAAEVYLQVLNVDPNNDVACYQLSRLYTLNNQISNALVFAEKASRLSPQNEWYLINLATLYTNSNQYYKSSLVYQKLVELFPEKLDYAYELANTYVRLQKISLAIAVYDELEKKFGVNDAWGMQKYKLYSFDKEPQKAEMELFKLVQTYPLEIKYLEILATMASEQKNYDKTYEYYQKILNIDPLNPYIQLNLVDYYLKVKNPDSAFSYLGRAMLNPSLDLKTKIQFLQVYYSEQAKMSHDIAKEAKVIFTNLTQAYPYEFRLHREYAQFLFVREEYESSRQELLTYIAADSSDFFSWGLLLTISAQLSDTIGLISYFERAVSIFPEQVSIYTLPLYYMQVQEEHEKVIRYAQQGLQYVLPKDKEIQFQLNIMLAEALFQKQRYAECAEVCKKSLELAPNDLGLMNNYAYYLSVAKINLEEAEKIGRKICQKEPLNYTFLDTYAWVLFQQEKYKEALPILEKAVSLSEYREPVLLEHYGDVLFKVGEEDKALEYWQKALDATEKSSKEYEILIQKVTTRKWVEK